MRTKLVAVVLAAPVAQACGSDGGAPSGQPSRDQNGAERPIVAPGASRLEEGHEYLVALDWHRGWVVLGSGATLPADGVVGAGEREGRLAAVGSAHLIADEHAEELVIISCSSAHPAARKARGGSRPMRRPGRRRRACRA